MGKGYIIIDGKRQDFVKLTKQKYTTSWVQSEAILIAGDGYQFSPNTIILPSYNSIMLQEIYVVSYANRGIDTIVPDLISVNVAGDNSAGFNLLLPLPTGTTLDPVQSRFSFKGNSYMQNLGMRFTRDNTTIIGGIFREAGFLVADAAVLALRFVFQDVDS